MTRKLTTNVAVDGTWYGPGSDIPAEVAERITNPNVWDGKQDTKAATASKDTAVVGEEPPRGGPGSSADAWRTFVTANKVDVPDGASAKEIAALWDEHKTKG